MIAAWMIAFFAVCPPGGKACEEGFVIARDCATAERHLRAGLRRDQQLRITECRPFANGDWQAPD
ncbi:hypothetical protein [Synechococcus phage MinM1]|nr:hypothetical protein [Synechococcus phage MinM1]